MAFRSSEFKSFFKEVAGAADSTCNTYNSYLLRIDRAIGGLDEAINQQGADAVINWGRSCAAPPFNIRGSHARSVLKRYVNFVAGRDDAADLDLGDDATPAESTADIEEISGLAFRLEREMQAAVRKQLPSVEVGLIEADGGIEVPVETGRIDILARSNAGELVVIELKAGVCPSGALEQALGYAQSLAEERTEKVRTIVIASEFSLRQRAAARRIPDLRLVKYEFALKFADVFQATEPSE